MPVVNLLNKSFAVWNIKGISIEPTYWQAGAIIILLFLLLFTLARLRFLYVHWSLGKGSISFLFYGFLLALILEGFLILSGRTLLTELLGWREAPKPIGTALEIGREKLSDVLGAESETACGSQGNKPTYKSIISEFDKLAGEDKNKVKSYFCSQ